MLQDTHITQETNYAPLDASIDKWNTERTHIRRLRIYIHENPSFIIYLNI
jgi:hypothetical protein